MDCRPEIARELFPSWLSPVGDNHWQKRHFSGETGGQFPANKYGATFLQKFLVTTICSATVTDAPQRNGVFDSDWSRVGRTPSGAESRFAGSFSLGVDRSRFECDETDQCISKGNRKEQQ